MSFYVFEAPAEVPEEIWGPNYLSVFLAGGISNCVDWQESAIAYLREANLKNLVVLNPRRKSFDISDVSVSDQQIEWEFEMLNRADTIVFWFTGGESVQPITLYELGYYTARKRAVLSVGCDPEYLRVYDVLKQSTLRDLPVRDNLYDVLDQIKVFHRRGKLYTSVLERLDRTGIFALSKTD